MGMRFTGAAKFLAVMAGLASVLNAQTLPSPRALPNPAPADQKFRLYLQLPGLCWSCGNFFSHESVTVVGSRIDLRYVVNVPTAPKSPPPDSVPLRFMSGDVPAFAMAPLPAGHYEVWTAAVPACLLAVPACKIAEPAPVGAGVLTVSGDVTGAYIPRLDSARAGTPFDLQVLSPGYSCATAYDSLAVQVVGDAITLTFYDYERPMGCALAYELAGPTFPIPALSAGTYRLKIERLSNHTRSQAGTLVVAGSVALRTPETRMFRPRTEPRGPGVTVVLPEGGTGIWSAEFLSPDGRAAGRATFLGTTGEPAWIPGEPRAPQGSTLLRLTAPDGMRRLTSVPPVR